MADNRGNGVYAAVGALLLAPMIMVTFLVTVAATQAPPVPAGCDPAALAAAPVDTGSAPVGPVAGYGHVQLVNAAAVMLAARRLGLTVRDQQIGVMTAMGESGLAVVDHGDMVGPDSRGLFQQRANGAWGSYRDRMDPVISATSFFTVERTIPSRAAMEPTLVAHAVQRNADPYYYRQFWDPAGIVVRALAGHVTTSAPSPAAVPVAAAPAARYRLGPVQPHTALVANTLGPMFGITTVDGYRPPTAHGYDPTGHPAGLALDFMIDNIPDRAATGSRLAAYAQNHAADLGVKYVIWQQHIWSPARASEGWRLMPDRGSPTQNHVDHVHVSLTATSTISGGSEGAAARSCPTVPGTDTAGPVSTSGWTAPAQGPITSTYGPRVNPATHVAGFHYGDDIGGGCNTPIWAVNAGTVVRAGPATGFGNLIELDHGHGIHTRYGHMYDSGLLVHVGDHVTAGQQIARIGSNGNSTGCHLHFEVLINGEHVDPLAFLTRIAVTIPH